MVSSDFRAEARKKLEGKWGKAACISLAYLGFSLLFGIILGFISGLLSLPESILDIISYIIEVPLSFGLIFTLLKLYNNEEVKAFDFLNLGFGNFGRSWGVTFYMFLKMLAPIILIIAGTIISILSGFSSSASSSTLLGLIAIIIIIVSIIWLVYKSYSYQLSYIIAIDNPKMSSKEAVEKSEELMNGKRWKLFCLEFSFIGWVLLSLLALYIPILWILPYIQCATIAFYKFANGNNSDVSAEVIEENNN